MSLRFWFSISAILAPTMVSAFPVITPFIVAREFSAVRNASHEFRLIRYLTRFDEEGEIARTMQTLVRGMDLGAVDQAEIWERVSQALIAQAEAPSQLSLPEQRRAFLGLAFDRLVWDAEREALALHFERIGGLARADHSLSASTFETLVQGMIANRAQQFWQSVAHFETSRSPVLSLSPGNPAAVFSDFGHTSGAHVSRIRRLWSESQSTYRRYQRTLTVGRDREPIGWSPALRRRLTGGEVSAATPGEINHYLLNDVAHDHPARTLISVLRPTTPSRHGIRSWAWDRTLPNGIEIRLEGIPYGDNPVFQLTLTSNSTPAYREALAQRISNTLELGPQPTGMSVFRRADGPSFSLRGRLRGSGLTSRLFQELITQAWLMP